MLDVPYYKQDTNYSCGAASVQMLLRFFNILTSERDLMDALGTVAVYGTHHQPIIEYITSQGLYCYVNTESEIDEVEYHLVHQKLPVMVHYIEPSTNEHHYSIVIAVHDDAIVLHDPWNGPRFALERDDFVSRWHDDVGAFPRWLLVASTEDVHVGRQYRPQTS